MGAFPDRPSTAGVMSEAVLGECSMFLGSRNGESLYEFVRKDAISCGCRHEQQMDDKGGQALFYHASE